jgi:hypothetical protein
VVIGSVTGGGVVTGGVVTGGVVTGGVVTGGVVAPVPAVPGATGGGGVVVVGGGRTPLPSSPASPGSLAQPTQMTSRPKPNPAAHPAPGRFRSLRPIDLYPCARAVLLRQLRATTHGHGGQRCSAAATGKKSS